MQLGARSKSYLLLLTGTALIILGHYRWSVGIAAWAAPAPLLIYLKRTKGVRSRGLFLVALGAGFIGASLKIITPPLVWPMAVVYGLAAGVGFGAGYLIWERLVRGASPLISHLTFAAVQITVEWLFHRFTPLGAVGAAAYTQMDDLPFLQSASLLGIAGIGFLMYWFAAFLADGVETKKVVKSESVVLLMLVLFAHGFGAYRLGCIERHPQRTVAAVHTDFKWVGPPLPSPAATAGILDTLFERSAAAARTGARVVAWPEVAAVVEPAAEAALIEKGRALAKKTGVHLVPAYLRLVSREPLLFENKLVWIDDEGRVDHTYLKHHPVPFEPSVAGDGPVRPVATGWGTLAAAICYDFDFPRYALRFARAHIDLVVLPSSENLGMEILHPQIAALRAIEGGYSILRPARLGRSAGIDPVGREVGWMSDNIGEEPLLRVTLPAKRKWTLYTHIGDLLVYLAIGFIVSRVVWMARGMLPGRRCGASSPPRGAEQDSDGATCTNTGS